MIFLVLKYDFFFKYKNISVLSCFDFFYSDFFLEILLINNKNLKNN